MTPARHIPRSRLPLLGAALVLAACASTKNPSYEEGMALVGQGRHEQGLVKLEQAVREEPDNSRYRLDLLNARTNHVTRLIADAQNARNQGRVVAARELYEKARIADPGSERVKQGLDELRRDERHAEAVKLARQLEPVLGRRARQGRAAQRERRGRGGQPPAGQRRPEHRADRRRPRFSTRFRAAKVPRWG